MKILYILPFIPWEVRVRSYNLIPRLARRHEIYLVCVSRVEFTPAQNEWLSRYCKQVRYVPHSASKAVVNCATALLTRTPLRIAYCRSMSAQEAVKRMYDVALPDVVYVERWRALEFVPPELDVPVVCDPTDSMTLYNRRLMKAGAWWERLLAHEEYWKFSQYEGKLAQRANACVFCSRWDLQYVKEQTPDKPCEVVPNGVDCQSFFFKELREQETGTIVFSGSFNYRPNRYAVDFFLEKIFPRIRKEAPEAQFVAVGNGAKKTLTVHQGRAGFEAVDFVPDVRPYLAKASVAVAPLTVGSGVSNKLGEGFAVGTPVVATPIACGDLPVRHGEHLLIAQDAAQFAEHVTRLLTDVDFGRRMAVRARRLVEENYDWEIVSRKMEDVLYNVTTTRTTRSVVRGSMIPS